MGLLYENVSLLILIKIILQKVLIVEVFSILIDTASNLLKNTLVGFVVDMCEDDVDLSDMSGATLLKMVVGVARRRQGR